MSPDHTQNQMGTQHFQQKLQTPVIRTIVHLIVPGGRLEVKNKFLRERPMNPQNIFLCLSIGNERGEFVVQKA